MRILVYSQTRLFAECLARGLELQDDVALAVGLCAPEEAAAYLETTEVSAIIVDLSNARGWIEVRRLKEMAPAVCLLGLAVGDSAEDFVQCAQAGCGGVIPYDTPLDRTVAIVRRAIRGEVRCSPAAVASLMRALGGAPADSRPMPDSLTRRERQVCGLVCDGLTNKEIARQVGCSEGTVKNHVHNILAKLNIPRRSALGRRLREGAAGDTSLAPRAAPRAEPAETARS